MTVELYGFYRIVLALHKIKFYTLIQRRDRIVWSINKYKNRIPNTKLPNIYLARLENNYIYMKQLYF